MQVGADFRLTRTNQISDLFASADRSRRDKTSQGSCGFAQIFDLFWKIERFSKKFFVVKIFASSTYSILNTFRFRRNVILHFVHSSYRLLQSALLPGIPVFSNSFDRLPVGLFPIGSQYCWTQRVLRPFVQSYSIGEMSPSL